MADIKTKDNAKGTIRTIDKAAVATQRMKQAYIATKEKAERSVNANSSSAEEYASDKLESGIDEVVHDGAYAFDKAGRKGLETTKENIRTAKDGIQRFKQQRAEQLLRKQASQNTSSAIKTVDKAEKTIKQSATSSGKKTIKFAGKEATKTAQKSVKTAEQTAKTAIKTSQQAAKAAQKTAQATVKASQKAAQAAKATAKATAEATKATVRATITAVKPIIAECGGFMYVCNHLVETDDSSMDMLGLIDTDVHMTKRLSMQFGYVTLNALCDTAFFKKNTNIRAHEFHYSKADKRGDSCEIKKYSGKCWNGLYAKENIMAGYPHFYFHNCREVAERFVDMAEKISKNLSM